MPKSSSQSPASPNEKKPHSTIAARVKSNIRKTLLASPYFPRLYADVVLAYAPNSNEAKILAPHYKKIVDLTNLDRTNLERTSTQMSNCKTCTHIKVTGVPCGCPALRGEQFCYFHQRMLRTVKAPDSRVHHAALLEDEESIQASLIEVVNALLRGTIEIKRAELVLRALNTAVRNIRRVNLSRHADMVREIPTYAPAPAVEVDETARAEAERQATRAEIARIEAAHLAPANLKRAGVETARVGKSEVGTTHVGTAAPGCPGGPEVPGRSAVNSQPDPTRRKPPASVKAEAPKERKNAAHGASHG
jgi:hypothetical protein